ncbi:hypothetical protein AC578_4863 [Pseudocercospora eumusae]|uniref:Uncharacterized protein n=1 Tax=Pseudocercospora eumusae TaxID=321146 RepID=A0A139HC53_9PEZI|nr:hypothetical protein AC578_4863 [Pseudocercospora eumusae]
MAKGLSAVFVFGPHDLDVNPDSLKVLRETLLEPSNCSQWIADAILDLPQKWQNGRDGNDALKNYAGSENLTHLVNWLRKGQYQGTFPLPNINVTPVVVATQLSQFVSFVRRHQPGIGLDESFTGALKASIQTCGMCTGLLSAAAVASSTTLSELERNGRVAINLAMAIGALVDTTNERDWSSFVAGWTKSIEGEERMRDILRSFTDAYIAVQAEPRQVTITAPQQNIADLMEQFTDAGFTTTLISLRGTFHHPEESTSILQLLSFFDTDPDFHFSPITHPMLPQDGQFGRTAEPLHYLATRGMLHRKADWHLLCAHIKRLALEAGNSIVSFGRKRCLPPVLIRQLESRLIHAGEQDSPTLPNASNDDIAIIGLACHFPGGRDINEFWSTLCTGQSQHVQVPEDRIRFNNPWRKHDPNHKWFGNFIDGHAEFDQKFFKKTPVEMASTDPQQRLIMQVGYQAVLQSGYFATSTPNTRVGCYVGIGPCDYEGGVACHEPGAYTATGNLRSFAAGKISHFFGWSSPSLTIDTACSSSAVAIHEACKAILTGECDSALAGGTNHLSGEEWFQNLAGASFLSHEGQCKPFDAAADGYCRGEGAGAVMLKRYSDALRDGDQIYGVIKSTFVGQNENCSAITAPSARSLADGFRTVVAKAGLDTKQISVVEAHGTGTQVGDLAEYTAIREVFTGDGRASPIILGSAKGHIGHLESASGVASVIKTLLMMQYSRIPPQASHQSMNPKFPGTQGEIQIATQATPWDNNAKAALINNYGASGSNVHLVIAQPADLKAEKPSHANAKQPFWLSAHTDASLAAYATKLAQFIKSTDDKVSIADFAFQLSLQSNRSLDKGVVFAAASRHELLERLDSLACQRPDKSIHALSRSSSPRPVILAFGGQVSSSISVNRDIYDNVSLFRDYLDLCDQMCVSMGCPSILPRVFDPAPHVNIVQLQLTLFSVLYASAKCWIDSGVRVAAVVGHSFGELAAMCISGTLSLSDALRMVMKRSRLIQRLWGVESGCMLWVEADQADVHKLLEKSQSEADIACVNGPRSFTIGGPKSEINKLQNLIDSDSSFTSMRSKLLTVTNAFHTRLVDPLLTELRSVGEEVIWRESNIHLEHATKEATSHADLGSDFFARHMRDPVYFDAAVRRLDSRYPDAIWIEVGTETGITSMAGKALGSSKAHFQQMSLTGIDRLTDATVNLWKQGLALSFWGHHRSQTRDYSTILLPPYQFSKQVHWLERKEPAKSTETVTTIVTQGKPELWTFSGYQASSKNSNSQEAHFSINTASSEFQTHSRAHVIADALPICPTGFQCRIATEAIMSLAKQEGFAGTLRSELLRLENHNPIILDDSKQIRLIAQKSHEDPALWKWRLESFTVAGGKSTLHANGELRVIENSPLDNDRMFARYERLVNYQQCKALLADGDADSVLQGQRGIYSIFAPMVRYAEDEYKALTKIVAKGNESAARIVRMKSSDDLHVGLCDAFCQVAGLFTNCMADCNDDEMCLNNGTEHWIGSAEIPGEPGTVYEAYARHHKQSESQWLSDIFVFEATSGRLLAIIFGMSFVKLKISAMARMLNGLAGSRAAPSRAPTPSSEKKLSKPAMPTLQLEQNMAPVRVEPKPKSAQVKAPSPVEGQLRGILCDMLGLETEDIKLSSDLIDLGIDSLLAMELARDTQRVCGVELDTNALLGLTDFQSYIDAVRGLLGEDTAPGSPSSVSTVAHDSGYGTPDLEREKFMLEKLTIQKTTSQAPSSPLSLSDIIQSFSATKAATDAFIEENKLGGFSHGVLPTQNELVLVHIIDAFEKLGCDLRRASAGQELSRVPHLPRHQQIVDVFYRLLDEARMIDLTDGKIIRTSIPVPPRSATALLDELLKSSPDHGADHKLTTMCGSKLAECLTGEAEGVQLLFGTAESREIVSASYAKSPIHSTMVSQLAHFFKTLLEQLPRTAGEPFKIMELGAGTGGTTSTLLPVLAASGVALEYTITDISPGLVAGLRKRFSKQYPFTRFEVVNMELAPPTHLLNQQHAILATNCVHATQDLLVTTKNISNMLRPGGLLTMIEMTDVLPWVDLVFGLTSGWWAFNDGRSHACIKPSEWEKTLRANGYGYVDWTEGGLPESGIQQIILAVHSDEEHHRQSLVSQPKQFDKFPLTDPSAREAAVNALVSQHLQGFVAPKTPFDAIPPKTRTALVTGATGSLGASLVATFARDPKFGKVVCLNRAGEAPDARARQLAALEARGLSLDEAALAKLHVIESDTAKPQLGVSTAEYIHLSMCVTDIVHNAWPMSLSRNLKGFGNQFKTMRNLINLARICFQCRGARIGFQLIGSIATVGFYPYVHGQGLVPETEMQASSAMTIGYAEAKLVCERMLNHSLRQYPEHFRATTVRLGQIAGSSQSGLWNSSEHIAQLLKSSQTLNALPDLRGDLSWCPVDVIATTLSEILTHDSETAHAVYHIENPVRQSWPDMIRTLATALHIPFDRIIPYAQWLSRVRNFPPSLSDGLNPAVRLGRFWEEDFVRMSCGLGQGGVVLDTTHSKAQSPTLRRQQSLGQDVVLKYIDSWKRSGFL